MPERFKPWPPTRKIYQGWIVGAIAIPVLLGMVWLLLNPRVEASEGGPSQTDTTALTPPYNNPLISSTGSIAAVAGGVLLVLNLRLANRNPETANLGGADLNGADLGGVDFSGANLNGAELNGANLSDADLSRANLGSADLNGAELGGANLNGANLNGANLISANLSGANLSGAKLRYADLSGADLRYANLCNADLRQANLSGADLNCALLSNANLSDTNLSGALLFYINSRDVQNLESLQLEAEPSPFLCNVALPAYSKKPSVNPNRDCDRIPQLLSARYDISLEEAQEIVYEARQHRWD